MDDDQLLEGARRTIAVQISRLSASRKATIGAMKVLAAILLVAVAALSLFTYRQGEAIRQLSTQLDKHIAADATEKTKTIPKNESATLDDQSKCGQQAKREFLDQGFKLGGFDSYTNHFNASLQKCFMRFDIMDSKNPKQIWTFINVVDAFEGKVYGQYAWHTVGDKKYWEVPPVQCSVTQLSGTEQKCTSQEDFIQLVSIYMGK